MGNGCSPAGGCETHAPLEEQLVALADWDTVSCPYLIFARGFVAR
jgi:hypothetical protein